ncbi:late competence development ComFB family protein [Sporomusa acidovorans]|uniref:Late competence development protein ComFB n=1 Tax=Sporomusa acidovorans (strain ATCC 49682 / DSM 3132 / Mol) TaxID=1123286 RepID=A0ABZ3J1J3_SPOA4|nr:late competence development ComFB family protein [Sporomusa acidovorans]OZC15027.1 late competence development protein ComFB [Sporomusa acidovorans DSM 3132]SDE84311.1 competence protein ComFB [Sporomusa acidovorans]
MQLKNYMEDLVWQRLDEVMVANPQACNCENCRYDIAALALNFLPPRYVVTDTGETYTRIKALESQFNIDIVTAITHALQIVSSKPHHYAGKN